MTRPLPLSATGWYPFELAETLHQMTREQTLPRDLPGRYGKAIKDLERLLHAADASSVVAGGWAVWRHGYAGRVTEDVDIVIAQKDMDRLQELATNFGFDFFAPPIGRWPKMIHRTTGIDIDLLPENGVPGVPSRPAPVPIGNPLRYQAVKGSLVFVSLNGLIELKLGAGRTRDIADLVELIKVNRSELTSVLEYLATIHPVYVDRFSGLIRQADEE
jgi:hypothetical protein